MVVHSLIAGRVPSEPIDAPASLGANPASVRRLEAYAIVPILGGGDRVGATASGTSPLTVTAVVETTLIAVLFLLISGIVAIRLTDVLSDRDVEPMELLQRSRSRSRSDEPSDGDGTRDPSGGSPTTGHQSFERYIAPDTPSELLSDEGEVVRLLVANDGRLRQHRIADETDWSKSKVSRICSQMDADGIIEKVSVGRENVITLADGSTDESARSDDVENPVA